MQKSNDNATDWNTGEKSANRDQPGTPIYYTARELKALASYMMTNSDATERAKGYLLYRTDQYNETHYNLHEIMCSCNIRDAGAVIKIIQNLIQDDFMVRISANHFIVNPQHIFRNTELFQEIVDETYQYYADQYNQERKRRATLSRPSVSSRPLLKSKL